VAKKPQRPKPELDKSRALFLAWSRGLLAYKLYDYQNILYETLWSAINDDNCLKYTLNCSRRWGKSTVLALISIEFALRHPESQIRFAAPTAKALKKITNPIFRMLCADAPKEFKPRYFTQDQMWKFPNGSEIHLAGTDGGNYESLRGTTSHLNCIDEAAFTDELDYVLKSVLMPQTLTTGGKTLLASTPPTSPAHDFYAIAQECEAEGYYKTYTIYDNKSLTPDLIAKYARESGGENSTTFKREYLCQFVVDETLQIVPEWKEEYIKDLAPSEFSQFYHRYVGMDLGVRDFTACIFGHYDFKRATLYIEDELTMNGHEMTTPKLVEAIRLKEISTFGDIKPLRRISDNNNLMLIQDMTTLHGLSFIPTTKEALEAMINEVRILVGEGRLVVSPKCKMLLGCLKYGIWNEKRTQFSRSSVYMHFDHLAALVYLIRNLDKVTNPIPATYSISSSTHYIPQGWGKSQSGNFSTISKLFNIKK
jgi:hypothetical protein